MFIENVDGVNGMMANLLITKDYVSWPRTADYYRKLHGDTMFTLVYSFQVLGRMLSLYPDMGLADIQLRNSACAALNMYAFNATFYDWAIVTPSPSPTEGTWRDDVGIAVQEMRNLAKNGPSKVMIIAISYLLSAANVAEEYTSGHVDSTELLTRLLDDEDPEHYYYDVHQIADLGNRFLSFGFADSYVDHVQSQAQFVFNAFVKVADYNYTKPVYTNVQETDEVSFSVILGTSTTPSYLPTVTEEEFKKWVTISLAAPEATSDGLAGLLASPGAGSNLVGALSSLTFSSIVENRPPILGLPKVVYSNNNAGVKVYELNNGINVNVKHKAGLDSIYPGVAYLEVVALGGASTENDDLKGACDYVNLNTVSGYWYHADQTEYVDLKASLVQYKCDQDYIRIMVPLSSGCVTYSGSSACDVSDVSYQAPAERVRVAMFPAYNYHVTEKGIHIHTMLTI